MAAFAAFLHHLAAFTLVACIAIEWILIRQPLSLQTARSLRIADTLYGVSAGFLLLIGSLRIAYFEKGLAYYMHNPAFVAKISIFAVVGILSIYPTLLFIRWGASLKRGQLPELSTKQQQRIMRILNLEIIGIILILLNAALMAKGIGS